MRSNDRNSPFDSFDGVTALTDTAVVLVSLAVHAIVLAFVAGPASRPLVLPFVIAVLTGVALFVADRVRNRRGHVTRSPRAVRWGVWLMGAVSVLGVANVWYATLDPGRPVLPSIATFTGSLAVTAVFVVMAASRTSDGP